MLCKICRDKRRPVCKVQIIVESDRPHHSGWTFAFVSCRIAPQVNAHDAHVILQMLCLSMVTLARVEKECGRLLIFSLCNPTFQLILDKLPFCFCLLPEPLRSSGYHSKSKVGSYRCQTTHTHIIDIQTNSILVLRGSHHCNAFRTKLRRHKTR